ncbi:alpha/beta fold hydrolase [Luteimonas terrae]|uniref:Pimeloyl-ACP methyl ester carboxylesterase n=1 Tax=Luteimonas terrae TaxID=1530191 RepID=A0ABU1Y0L9_9GAMM|nr:alpha/beta fold hydrolase [Luteimonas terrae]MDR7194498.1 pimeloyl-ACP methyl ester carboxylesterase [Luteimonas terrae]
MTGKTPLLLLPGLLCTARLWQAQMDPLGDVADPHVADLSQDDSVGAMAERALADAPPHFALAALSMGGYVAFEILRRAPERVSRLALIATSARPDSPERAAQRRRGIDAIGRGRFVGVTRQLLPSLVHPSHVDGPVGDIVQSMAREIGADGYLRQQAAILGRPDSEPVLARIDVPTLIVVGAQDRLTPPVEAEVMHAGIDRSTLRRLDVCGHLPPLERADDTSGLMRAWLEAV